MKIVLSRDCGYCDRGTGPGMGSTDNLHRLSSFAFADDRFQFKHVQNCFSPIFLSLRRVLFIFHQSLHVPLLHPNLGGSLIEFNFQKHSSVHAICNGRKFWTFEVEPKMTKNLNFEKNTLSNKAQVEETAIQKAF